MNSVKNKIRKEIIKSKISVINDSLEIIRENLPDEYRDFAKLGLVKDGIYKRLEFSIEAILDICSILNSDLRLGTPSSEDNILDNLENKKIISSKVVDLIREMKGFRNVLVHKYGDIDDEKAFEAIKEGLGDFEGIIDEVEKLLDR